MPSRFLREPFAPRGLSLWLVVVTCSFVIIRLNVNAKVAAIGFDILCTSFGSEASVVVPSFIKASNSNSSFRQDSTKRYVFRLDTIYLNVSSIRLWR